MTQVDGELESLVRKRIRALRVAQGWSLGELATRANVSQSTLSRIENGQRRLALDQLVTLARALDTTLDQLVETASDDVVPVEDQNGWGCQTLRMTHLVAGEPERLFTGAEWTEGPLWLPGTGRVRFSGREAAFLSRLIRFVSDRALDRMIARTLRSHSKNTAAVTA